MAEKPPAPISSGLATIICARRRVGPGLLGVTREFLLCHLRQAGWACSEVSRGPEALAQAHGVFLSVSGLGVVEVGAVDDRVHPPSSRVKEVRNQYIEAVRNELSD